MRASSTRKVRLLPIAFACGLAALPSYVLAQTAPAPQSAASAAAEEKKKQEEVKQLGRITVTATGRPQQASEVPYNVTAESEEALRENNVTDIKKAIQNSPSISAPQNSARFADSVTVRGLNVSPVNANNLEQFARSTLAYYLDDTPLPNIGYRIKDIARVETLLGPQGTLYGAGSLGGTVRYITNQPDFKNLGLRASTSVYQTKGGSISHDTDAVLNLPINDMLAARISLARLDDGGYTDRISNPSWRAGSLAWTTFPNPTQNLYKNDDYTKTNTARFAVALKATPDLKFTLSHAVQDMLAHGTSATSLLPRSVANATSQAQIDAYVRNPRSSPCTGAACLYTDRLDVPQLAGYDVVTARYPEFANRDFQMTALDVDWNLGFAKLRSSTSSFRDTRAGQADYASQGERFYFSFGDSGGKFDSGRSAFITFNNRYSGLSHETRLTSSGDGPLTWIAGLYHTKQKRSLRFSEFLPGLDAYNGVDRAAAGGNLDEGYRENLASEYKETAIYGEVGYKLTPKWLINVGGRFFSYDDRAIAQIRDYSFDLVNNNVDVAKGESGKSYFKLNAAYKLGADQLVYATASQGFRRGGTNGFRNLGANQVNPQAQQYQPDSTTNYEVGFKGFLLDKQLFVQANVYQIDWEDVQTYFDQDVDGFPVNGTVNAANARSKGFELATRWNINNQWQVRLASAYTDARWVSTKELCLYSNTTSVGCRTWAKGGKLGGAGAWKHTFGVRYSTDFANGTSGWIALNGRHNDKVATDRSDSEAGNAGVRIRPAYQIYDVRAGWSWDKLDLSVWVENVANKRAEVSQLGPSTDSTGPRLIYTTPLTIGVNASYTFY